MRYFLELAYKGKAYFGWQRQPAQISIQQVLEEKLSILLSEKVEIVGAGRTDTGVNAKQMYAHFDTDVVFDNEKLKFKLNSFLPKDIAIYKVIEVAKDAHARFDATARAYEYYINIGKDPFLTESSYQLNHSLDIAKMNEAAKILYEYTDFKCFSKSKTDVKTYNCDIRKAEWLQHENNLTFYIEADRFLRNMVRAIVGSLVEVGNNKITIDDFRKIIESRDRGKAGVSVPGHALYLTNVLYPYIN